ncbi:MAG TPA: N-acetylmuramoyl-L-alanine amidase [Gemmatimonadales bacterium]
MIAALLATAILGTAPGSVTIMTPAGERRIPVTTDSGMGQLIPAGLTLTALGGTSSSDGVWAEVRVGPTPFRFLLGARVYTVADKLFALASTATVRGDSLFLPLQFLTDALPRHLSSRFRWDPITARLVDAGEPRPPVTGTRVVSAGANAATEPTGGLFRKVHRVTIDPGHGGVDPGNPGLYFPSGIKEKHVTLEMGLLVRQELKARGVQVTMTRSRDTLIDLRDRGRYCAVDCDLFVSLHVNSLPRRGGYNAVRGFETYFLAEARTEDAARVARMENEAVRFDQNQEENQGAGGLDFILKDLQLNEYLRESARAAELVQRQLGDVHSGGDRGIKQAGLIVLNTARRPAILVEVGFSTNRADARLMTQTASQKRLAKAIAEAIIQYLVEYERKTQDSPLGPGSGGRE